MYLKYKRSRVMKPLSNMSPYPAQLEAPTINPCTFPMVAQSLLVFCMESIIEFLTFNNNNMYNLYMHKIIMN